ncbi:hypothetical protein VTN77DRAFT_9450 [Rasamsonia byssochlamydoides]|uniref:uncharacterized protein n=1 Tax=Rasamsonia byssochlamydoides TaxID=89139 RepID=UPI003742E4DB
MIADMSNKTWEKLFPATAPPSRKVLRIVVALSVVVGFFLFSHRLRNRYDDWTSSAPQDVPPERMCGVDVKLLGRYGLSGSVHYVRREIIARHTDKPLPMSTRLDIPLLDTHSVNLSHPATDQESVNNNCSEPIYVEVPIPPAPVDASHIDFAIATTADRLLVALDAFAHWASDSNARIFALIEPHQDTKKIKRKASALGIDLSIFESDAEYNSRYSSLVKLLADNLREETKWCCIMDDDTFFPSLPRLVEMLAQYDETKPYYIGGLSESDKQVAIFGIIAYGGAGMFFSRPLMEQLRDVWDDCKASMEHGDGKIAHCIYQYTTTKLTIDPGLRQLDLMGDASGFFEAARPVPVSVHHWRSWFNADMVKLSAVTLVCGTSCLLRQWRFSDGWILTNGYSVIRYSTEIPDNDISMEKTWDDMNGATDESWLYTLGPLRPKDPKKFSYRLEDVVIEDGQIRQFYIHRSGLLEGDRVLELAWRME